MNILSIQYFSAQTKIKDIFTLQEHWSKTSISKSAFQSKGSNSYLILIHFNNKNLLIKYETVYRVSILIHLSSLPELDFKQFYEVINK